jgi:hypothetical protein
MTLKLRIWIALAALVFGLTLAGTAEGRTCTCRTVHHRATHRVHRHVVQPQPVTYNNYYSYYYPSAPAPPPVYTEVYYPPPPPPVFYAPPVYAPVYAYRYAAPLAFGLGALAVYGAGYGHGHYGGYGHGGYGGFRGHVGRWGH